MINPTIALLFGLAALSAAHPSLNERTVTALDPAAFAEAQQRDATATRAFSSVPITTSDGQCLSVDELSGDFRANLTPIQIAPCNNSAGQKWDVITSGKHNNAPNSILVVNTLTQACMNFDPRRAAGNQVIMFSCGGRADGGGAATNSQLFGFTGGNGPLTLRPENSPGTCFTVKGAVVDQAACVVGSAGQEFTFGGGAVAAIPPNVSSSGVVQGTTSSAAVVATKVTDGGATACGTVTVTVTKAAVAVTVTAKASSCKHHH